MKKIIPLLIFYLLNINTSNGQEVELPHFSSVVEIDSATKDELYLAAKQFFAVAFKSGKDVLQLDDKDNGKLIGKFTTSFPSQCFIASACPQYLTYTIEIDIKDGKYKYDILAISLTMICQGIETTYDMYGDKPNATVQACFTKQKRETLRITNNIISDMKSLFLKFLNEKGKDW